MWSVLWILAVFPLAIDANKCVVGKDHITDGRLVAPESYSLQDVGDKKCGFLINIKGPRTYILLVADKPKESDEMCYPYDENYTYCVCPFFGCNSISGILFETLLEAYNQGKPKKDDGSKERRLAAVIKVAQAMKGEPSSVFDRMEKNRRILPVLSLVAKVYNKPGATGKKYRNYDGYFNIDMIKKDYPSLFPSEEKRKALLDEGNGILPTSPQPITDRPTPSSTPQSSNEHPTPRMSLKLSKAKKNQNTSDEGGTNVVLFVGIGILVVLILVVAATVTVVLIRKRREKINKGGEMETKSSDTNAETTTTTDIPPKNNNCKLSTRPANDMDTVNACKSNWSTMPGITHATQPRMY